MGPEPRPDVVLYLRANRGSLTELEMRRQLHYQGVSDAEFEAALAEAELAEGVVAPPTAYSTWRFGRMVLGSLFFGLLGGVGLAYWRFGNAFVGDMNEMVRASMTRIAPVAQTRVLYVTDGRTAQSAPALPDQGFQPPPQPRSAPSGAYRRPAPAVRSIPLPAPVGAPQAVNSWTLTGRVCDIQTLQPVKYAQLVIAMIQDGFGPPREWTVSTDNLGRYSLTMPLAAEAVEVRAAQPGYAVPVLQEPDIPYRSLSRTERADLAASARDGDLTSTPIRKGEGGTVKRDLFLASKP